MNPNRFLWLMVLNVAILFIKEANAQPEGRKWGGYAFFSSPGSERGHKIQTDMNGNMYAGGEYAAPFVIGNDTLNANGYSNHFVVKYNRFGSKQWIKKLHSPNLAKITAIEVDVQENVYVTGSYRDSLVIDQFRIAAAGISSNQPGFIAKFNKQGTVQWLTRIGNGATSNAVAAKIASNGNLIVAGNFFGISNTFGSHNLVTLSNTTHLYVISVSPNGAVNWVTYSKGDYNQLFDLALDKDDNAFICGTHNSNITINGLNYVLPNQYGSYDTYLIKLNAAGSVLWGKSAGSAASDMAKSLDTDEEGNCYVYGYWGNGGSQHQAIFDSIHILSKTPGKSYSYFLAKYNATGDVLWVNKFDEFDAASDLPHMIRTDKKGNCYLSGYFTGVWFGQNIQDTILFSGPTSFDNDLAIQQFLPDGQRGWNVVAGNKYSGTYEAVEDFSVDHQGNILIAAVHGGYDSLRIGDTVVGNTSLTDLFLARLAFQNQLVEPGVPLTLAACPGDMVALPFKVNDTVFSAANVFTLQVSNQSGLFDSPVMLGSKNTNLSDTFVVQIPLTLPQGSGYRFRISASEPAFHSFDNGNDFTIYSRPALPLITKNDTTLTCNLNIANYQWYRNDSLIPGATARIYHASENGVYKVMVTNTSGCSRLSDTISLIKGNPVGLTEAEANSHFVVYPNPVSSSLFIQTQIPEKPSCFNLLGKQLPVQMIKTPTGYLADMSGLADGVYILKLSASGKEWCKKITVVKN